MSRRIQVNVIAPVSIFDGLTVSRAAFTVPRERDDESLSVFHPRWLNVPGGSPVNAFLLAAAILFLIARLRKWRDIDILDAHFGYIDGVAACIAAAILRKPFMITLRGSEVIHARYPVRRYMMSWAFRRAAAVIAVSSPLRQFALALGVKPELTSEIPNGVNADTFHPHRAASLAELFGIEPKAKIIVTVGNLISLKGHHRLIAAIPHLVDRGLDAHLIIVGHASSADKHYSQFLHNLAGELAISNRVHFAGALSPDHVADLMGTADVFCLASEREGCPNVVREALACGTPVVATRVGAVPQLVPEARYGIIIPPNDDEALRKGLSSALSQSWDRHSIASWGASRSWEKVADEVLMQMESVLHQ